MSNLAGKKVAILGAGSSGKAAARLALAKGAEVALFDTQKFKDDLPETISLHPQATAESHPDYAPDLVVISPGIESSTPFVQSFLTNPATELWGEIELAARFFHGKIIGITGTNGKTTTTEVTDHLLRAIGITSVPCGNYGTPFSEVVLAAEPPQAVALELSSFQLETIHEFRPDVAVWLNFSPDHMDRYHSVDDYRAAKMRIFENLRPGDHVIVRAGQNLTLPDAAVSTFSSETEADWSLRDNSIFHLNEHWVEMGKTRLHGRHNAENIMAACAAVSNIAPLTPTHAAEALFSYAPPKHRCELIRTLDGVFYLNDSKATNLHALESALKSQDQPILLIAGGKHKGLDYQDLLTTLGCCVRHSFVFGEIGPDLQTLFSQVIPSSQFQTLEEATLAAQKIAQRGDVVLLSPGTSSYDQFTGYEQRGDTFRRTVLNLS